jgi:hypothetical protein
VVKNGSKREATWEATRRLREKHPEDWRALLAAEYRARGIPVPPTREEKADTRLQEILREYPDLGAKYNLGPASNDEAPAAADGKAAAKR